MKKILSGMVAIAAMLVAQSSAAEVKLFACEPEWAALATEIGGDKVKVASATVAMQDPHHIDMHPAFVEKARDMDLLVCTGMKLEAGWLPTVIAQSGNKKIAAGMPGNFEAGQFIRPLDLPSGKGRREGSLHPAGNPHIQQDPRNIAKIADALAKRLAKIDPENAGYYRARHKDFSIRWNVAIKKWEERAAPLKGIEIVEHHANMAYLAHWLGMKIDGAMEPKPGVDPDPAYLTQLLNRLKGKPVRMVVRASYQDGRGARWFSDHAQIHSVAVPFTVGGNREAIDLFTLFDNTIEQLLDGAK